MRNTISLLAFILLLISLAVNWIQLKSAQEQESWRTQDLERFQKEQSRKLGQISKRDSLISSLLNERKDDSTKYASEQSRLKTKINSLRAKITGPAVVQDTIIVFQDSLIASISSERDTLYLTDNQAIDSLNAQIIGITDLFKDQALRAAEAEGRLDKEKSNDFTIGPAIGIDYRGKPTVSIGVTYRLWSFRLKRK